MARGRIAYLLAGTILCGAAAPALAQSADPRQSSASADDQGHEIIVTARYRDERLQDVPIAVTAFDQRQIDDARIQEVGDFVNLTPNVTIAQSESSGLSALSIRGITQVRNSEAPVAVVVDGVLQNNPRQFAQELLDIASIQVLRGPQGALYGRNATGGAIIITTRMPTNELADRRRIFARRLDRRRDRSRPAAVPGRRALCRPERLFRQYLPGREAGSLSRLLDQRAAAMAADRHADLRPARLPVADPRRRARFLVSARQSRAGRGLARSRRAVQRQSARRQCGAALFLFDQSRLRRSRHRRPLAQGRCRSRLRDPDRDQRL
jgi:hypothetical protein